MLVLAATTWAAPPAIQFPHAGPPRGCEAEYVEIAITGDIMMHGQQLRAARGADRSLSLRGVFDEVAPFLTEPDLAIANLETTISGEDLMYTGFPRFNSPYALLPALREAGFDLLQTVNNHCLDRGEIGLRRTLDAVESQGFLHTGTFRSPQDRASGWAMASLPGGLRLAYLAYGYSGGVPPERPWVMNTLSPDLILHDVRAARAAGADLVFVGLHWGREYQHEPDPHQRDVAQRLIEGGVDVLVGTHPHVLQPVQSVPVTEAGITRDALILYSLGNFVSNQRTHPRDGGVIVRLIVGRCPWLDVTWLDAVYFTPVWVDQRNDAGDLSFRVIPVSPPGSPCHLVDLTPQDCASMERFGKHAATLLPADQFLWAPARLTDN